MKANRKQPMGSKAVPGSEAARRLAALMLESWCGVRTTQAASEAMGMTLSRYYQLEARALQAVVAAMEPRSPGRHVTMENELQQSKKERLKLLREVERYQTLYRATQRALGVSQVKVTPPGKAAAGKRRKRRQRARAEVVANDLRTKGGDDANGPAEQGQQARGSGAGRSDGEGAAARDPGDDDG